MIPAILSCIFVIYLYQKLNHGDVPQDSSADDASAAELLSTRVDRIQTRLDKLAKGIES